MQVRLVVARSRSAWRSCDAMLGGSFKVSPPFLESWRPCFSLIAKPAATRCFKRKYVAINLMDGDDIADRKRRGYWQHKENLVSELEVAEKAMGILKVS